jgi:protein-disulfide isomerase
MCIFSYAVNLLLLFYTWLIRRRFKGERLYEGLKADLLYLHARKLTFIPVAAGVTAVAVLMILFFPRYWHMQPPAPARTLNQGITPEGHPWIGAANPLLTIVEFSDYQCFQCRKMHYFLRQLVSDQPDRLRLVHRHFPMDHKFNPIVTKPYHEGSGYMAMIAVFAADFGKFWDVNDLLFDAGARRENLRIRKLAEHAGFDFETLRSALRNRAVLEYVLKDIRDGLKLGLTGTPGFVVENQLYSGQIPPEKLREVLR